MKISKSDLIKENISSLALSDGMYEAAVVGYMVSTRKPFNDPDGDAYQAVRFAFQLCDDNDNPKIVQSPDYKLSFSEKSNLYKQLSGWVKSTDPSNLWDRMKTAGFITEDDEFVLDKFLGVSLTLMVNMQTNKKDASKQFPVFQFCASKKGKSFKPVLAEDGKLIPCWLPSFVEDSDIIEALALDGFEWKRFESDEAATKDNAGSSADDMPC